MTVAEPTSRSMDELKRLVISALDKNGALAELRSTVKLHVTRAINEESSHSTLVHHRTPRVAGLMASDRGQLMAELIVDFLRHYDLKDSMSMLLVEAGLPKLRPSESEVASQCGFSHSPNLDLSVIEQLLSRQGPPHPEDSSPPPLGSPPADTSPCGYEAPDRSQEDDSLLMPVNTSLETDMAQMRRISAEIERISKEPDEKYEDDFEESPHEVPRASSTRSGRLSDDNVLFESRDSFKDLGETPAYLHPMEGNDHIELVEKVDPSV